MMILLKPIAQSFIWHTIGQAIALILVHNDLVFITTPKIKLLLRMSLGAKYLIISSSQPNIGS